MTIIRFRAYKRPIENVPMPKPAIAGKREIASPSTEVAESFNNSRRCHAGVGGFVCMGFDSENTDLIRGLGLWFALALHQPLEHRLDELFVPGNAFHFKFRQHFRFRCCKVFRFVDIPG